MPATKAIKDQKQKEEAEQVTLSKKKHQILKFRYGVFSYTLYLLFLEWTFSVDNIIAASFQLLTIVIG